MPPHIFHALSDDPSRWERQFGCMAALFHMLHDHQPRFFRKRSSTSGSSGAAAAFAHSHFQSASCVNKQAVSAKASNNDHQMETVDDHTNSANKRSSEGDHRRPEVAHRGTTASCDFSGNYSTLEAMAPCSSDKVLSKQKESPSILNSTNYTIREPPRTWTFEGAHSPDHQSTPSAGISCSNSLSGSPYVGFSHKARDARSQFATKSLFDKPRVPLDYDRQGQVAALRRRKSHSEECTYNETCKGPLEEIKESLRALAKLQVTTQQFVDGFEAQKYDDKPPKKTTASSLPWWNARKVRNSNNRHGSKTSSVSFMEDPALVARTSSFDYTEAIRISQKLQETPVRLSLDGRELIPKAVLKLREAMRLGTVNTDQATTYSSGDDQKKRIKGASLRSALLASKEDFEGMSSNSTLKAVAAKSQRSNVIARLMGLHDLPPRPTESKSPGKLQSGLSKDVQKYPWRWENRSNISTPHAEYCSRAQHKSDCSIGTLEQTRSVHGAEGASKLVKMEAFDVHEDSRAPDLQKDPLFIHREDDHCKVIREIKLPIAPTAISHFLNIDPLKDNGPAANIPKYDKMEVMPSHFLKARAGDRRSGRAEHSHHSETKSAMKLQEGFKLDTQEYVKGSQDVEFELRRRQAKIVSSNLVELQHNSTVEVAMQLKHIQKNLEYDCVQKREISDEIFHQSKHASRRCSQNTVTQSHIPELESKLVERPKVMQPRCRTKTLSMETHFPFDVAIAENEENGQIGITMSTNIVNLPKLPVAAKAHAAASASSSPTSRQREYMSNHYRSDKRNLSEHNKKGPGTNHFEQVRKGEAADQMSKLVIKQPASPTCLLKHQLPAEAAKAGTGASSSCDRIRIIDPVAACKEYKNKSSSNRKTKSLNSTRRAVRNFSEMCAEESARAKAGAGSRKLSKQRKLDRNGDESHKGLGNRTKATIAGGGTSTCTTANSGLDHQLAAGTDLSKSATTDDVDIRPVSSFQSAYANHDNAEVAAEGLLNGQFEYVQAILEHAGLLGNKDEEVERRLASWVTSDYPPAAIFWEMEHSCSTLLSASDSRHQRKLIFDCVHHILAVRSCPSNGWKRGLLPTVWNELKLAAAAADQTLDMSTTTSTKERVRQLLKRDLNDLEQRWSCSSPSEHLASSLQEAIFQDLLLELIRS